MEVQCPICGNGPSTISSDPEDLALLKQFTINLCQDTGEDLIALKPEDIPCKGCTSMLTAYLEGKRRIQEIINGLKGDNILLEIKRVLIAGESIKVELNGVQLVASQLDTSDTSTILQILVGKALTKINRKLENLKQTKSEIERVIREAKSSLISEFSSDFNAGGGYSGGQNREESTPIILTVVSENPESDQAAFEVKEEESEAIVESEVCIPVPLHNDDNDKQEGTDDVYILTTSSAPPSSSSGSSLQLRRASKIKKTIAQLQNRHRMVTRNVAKSKEGMSDNEIAKAQLNFLLNTTGKSEASASSRFRTCDACGISCSSKSNLKMHLKNTHLKLGVRVCTKCGATCSNNSNYKAHRIKFHKEDL